MATGRASDATPIADESGYFVHYSNLCLSAYSSGEKSEVAAQLANALRSLHPSMQKYKNLLPFREALLTSLDSHAFSQTSV